MDRVLPQELPWEIQDLIFSYVRMDDEIRAVTLRPTTPTRRRLHMGFFRRWSFLIDMIPDGESRAWIVNPRGSFLVVRF